MDIVKFEGHTRVLGESQGYRGLPIKDALFHDENGNAFNGMISVWKPTEEELMILMHGGYIMLTVVGIHHPPVVIDVLRNE